MIVYKKTDEWYIKWQRVVQRVITNDSEWYNEWQRVVQRVTTNDNEWYNEWQRVTTGGMEWREVTTSDNFGQTSFFQIIWCWYEPFFISLLKLSTSYLLFIIKMCFFFFDEKQMFCFVLQKDARLSLTCFVIKQKPLVKTVKTHGKFL